MAISDFIINFSVVSYLVVWAIVLILVFFTDWDESVKMGMLIYAAIPIQATIGVIGGYIIQACGY